MITGQRPLPVQARRSPANITKLHAKITDFDVPLARMEALLRASEIDDVARRAA
jgi:hypothetical protein